MCRLCDQGQPQLHDDNDDDSTRWNPRRGFLKAGAAAGTAGGLSLLSAGARADNDRDRDREPEHSGRHGRRVLIRGGAVMSMDPKVGDFAQADVLIEGKKIAAVGPNLQAACAAVIDARGRIVMPGFIDTHHHLFETATRSTLPYARAERFNLPIAMDSNLAPASSGAATRSRSEMSHTCAVRAAM